MDFEKIWNQFVAWALDQIPNLILAVVIFFVGWHLCNFLVKLIRNAMARANVDGTVISFISSFAKITLKIIVCIIAVAQLGINTTAIIAALGTAGVAVGLALKDNMSNIASGVQIIFTHPFHAGDYLSIDDEEGTVQRIEIMYTVLRTFDNKEIIIPNTMVINSVIENYTAMKQRRLDLNYSVSYQTDLQKAKRLLSEVVSAHPMALQDPAPLIAVGEHRDSCINMVCKVWCKSEDYWPLYFDMQEKVKLVFDENGIEIPFPQMDVHIQPQEDARG